MALLSTECLTDLKGVSCRPPDWPTCLLSLSLTLQMWPCIRRYTSLNTAWVASPTRPPTSGFGLSVWLTHVSCECVGWAQLDADIYIFLIRLHFKNPKVCWPSMWIFDNFPFFYDVLIFWELNSIRNPVWLQKHNVPADGQNAVCFTIQSCQRFCGPWWCTSASPHAAWLASSCWPSSFISLPCSRWRSCSSWRACLLSCTRCDCTGKHRTASFSS